MKKMINFLSTNNRILISVYYLSMVNIVSVIQGRGLNHFTDLNFGRMLRKEERNWCSSRDYANCFIEQFIETF